MKLLCQCQGPIRHPHWGPSLWHCLQASLTLIKCHHPRPSPSTKSPSSWSLEWAIFFLLYIFLNGHIITLIVGGYHALQCPHCSQPIKTSIPSTILLGNSSHFNASALTSHCCRKPCIIALSRKEHVAAITVLEITSPALLFHSITPHTSSVVSRSTSFNSQFSLLDLKSQALFKLDY